MNSADIRRAFLDYFAARGHQVVASSSLVPEHDATLLFTNAGMVQFKDTFLGFESRPYTRAASVQRCVRAGGKHNDLENVGYTARHHTLFEMLGNFSFGDYFKREAIQYAWEFLTQVLAIPVSKLWVTVYEDDDEAAQIWLNDIGVAPERLSRCGAADNFWSMGDTGPCGPCTEIFYDHGPSVPGGPPGSLDADGDRYIEIWNLVFMQFNRDSNGHLHPLPKPSVDTGMGLERIAAVLQHVHSNYQIDSFVRLIAATVALCPEPIDIHHPSLNVIADHIRACAFLIADGVMPSNEGRGYVLRRIIRRAVRHGHQLNLPMPFFALLVPSLITVMGDAYPVLCEQQHHIETILEQEERQFAKTLEQGLVLLKQAMREYAEATEIPGEVAFKLYDTYGFPLDLTADMAREHQLTVDHEGFERCMQRQREQSQSASTFRAHDSLANSALQQVSVFSGYTEVAQSAEIQLLLSSNGQTLDRLRAGESASIVLDATPFYAESGGQVGDRGLLRFNNGQGLFRVDDTQRRGQAILHCGELLEGECGVGDSVLAEIDITRRNAVRLNHTATHLLHAALQEILGPQVQQKGSLVDAERARFDFAYTEALTPGQLTAVEALVNDMIHRNVVVETDIMSLDAAKASGAAALFGEKYTDSVRVLSMGEFSKELCGGTHANRTGDLGLFKLVNEYGVASGIRRIEWVTGQYALQWVNQQQALLEQIAQTLKANHATDIPHKLTQVLTEAKEHERRVTDLQRQLILQSIPGLLTEVQMTQGIGLLVKQYDNLDGANLRLILDELRSRLQDAVIVLLAIQQDKMQVVVGVSPSIVKRVPNAAELIRHLCGKGGGRPDMAQGGGLVPADLAHKLTQMRIMVEEASRS
jgi:alanyl-tRNA synthetase